MASGLQLDSFTLTDLYREVYRREGKLKNSYGESLCSILGCETVESIPEIQLQPLSPVMEDPWCQVTPSQMGPHNLVRGIDSRNRIFVAMKCDLLDVDRRKITEIAVMHFSGISEDDTPTILSVLGANGVRYSSPFNSNGKVDLHLFKRVMNGEVIQHQGHYIRISVKV